MYTQYAEVMLHVCHFQNGATQGDHPNLVIVASLFRVGESSSNKMKNISYCPGGAHGVQQAHGLHSKQYNVSYGYIKVEN